MKIDTVTFDLWQTLIIDTLERGRPRMEARCDGIRGILQSEGVDCSVEEIREAVTQTYKICDKVRIPGGDVSFDEQVSIFLKSIDDSTVTRLSRKGRRGISDYYADAYLEHPPTLDEHAEFVLREMAGMGLKMALICNTGATPGYTQRVFLKQVGLYKYFDALIFSDEERLSKPAVAIFQRALERIGSRPINAIHVGDHYRNDVAGAKRAGMKAVWVRRNDKMPASYFESFGEAIQDNELHDLEVCSLDQILQAIDQMRS